MSSGICEMIYLQHMECYLSHNTCFLKRLSSSGSVVALEEEQSGFLRQSRCLRTLCTLVEDMIPRRHDCRFV